MKTKQSASTAAKEMANIPEAAVLRGSDALKLQVCVRDGSAIRLHPTQVKKWSECGGEIGAEFLGRNKDKV